jgi:hypothetical protein
MSESTPDRPRHRPPPREGKARFRHQQAALVDLQQAGMHVRQHAEAHGHRAAQSGAPFNP